MPLLFPIAVGLFALCADLFVREVWSLDAWSPDFLTVIVLWLGMNRKTLDGPLAAAALGLLADGFAGGPIGTHMLHAVLLYHLGRVVAKRVLFQGFFGRILLGMLGGLASLLVLVLISRAFLGDTELPNRIGALLVPRVLVVVFAVPLLFPVLSRIEALFFRRRDPSLL